MKLIHAYHQPPFIDADTGRRNALAHQTWEMASNIGNITRLPLELEFFKRTMMDGDRPMVYVKDIIWAGWELAGAFDDSYILLTNADTCFAPNICERIEQVIMKEFNDALSGPRRDFEFLDEPLTVEQIQTGAEYIGTDIFVFSRSWWSNHADRLPDMILGAEMWDHLLRGMMRMEYLPELSDLVYHEFHDSRWTLPQNRSTLPSQRHCQKIGNEWLGQLTPDQRAIVNYEDAAKANKHRAFTTARAARMAAK